MPSISELAFAIRRDLLIMAHSDVWQSLGKGLAAADILASLYEREEFAPSTVVEPNRPWIVLDGPDLTMVYHAALANRGYFRRHHLWNWGQLGSFLQAQSDDRQAPGIDAPQTPLGLGLAFALGIATGCESKIYCLVDQCSFNQPQFADSLKFWACGGAARDVKLTVIFTDKRALAHGVEQLSELGLAHSVLDGHDEKSLKACFDEENITLCNCRFGKGVRAFEERVSEITEPFTREKRSRYLIELRKQTHHLEEDLWKTSYTRWSGVF